MARKKKEFEIGDKVIIDDHEVIRVAASVAGCKTMQEELVRIYVESSNKLWELIQEKYPSVDLSKYVCYFSHVENAVVVQREK